MPELSFEVWCSCGNGLCRQTTVTQGRGGSRVEVEPCEVCICNAKKEGYEKGEDIGYNKGYSYGLSEGSAEVINQ